MYFDFVCPCWSVFDAIYILPTVFFGCSFNFLGCGLHSCVVFLNSEGLHHGYCPLDP